MELLQQCYMVEVDHKQLYPSIECYNDMYYIQYDLGNNHIEFELTDNNVHDNLWMARIKRKVVEWYDEITSY